MLFYTHHTRFMSVIHTMNAPIITTSSSPVQTAGGAVWSGIVGCHSVQNVSDQQIYQPVLWVWARLVLLSGSALFPSIKLPDDPHTKPGPGRHKTHGTPTRNQKIRLSVDANLQIPDVLNSASKKDLLRRVGSGPDRVPRPSVRRCHDNGVVCLRRPASVWRAARSPRRTS